MTGSSLVDYKCDVVIDNCLAGVAILLESHILSSRFVISLVLYDVSFQAVNQVIMGAKHCFHHVLKKMALYHMFLRKAHVVFGTSKNTRCSCDWPVASPLSCWALHLMSAFSLKSFESWLPKPLVQRLAV